VKTAARRSTTKVTTTPALPAVFLQAFDIGNRALDVGNTALDVANAAFDVTDAAFS
jgi:hypothetical protein